MSEQAEKLRAAYTAAGQGHVFAYWETLDAAQRAALLEDAAAVDLAELAELVALHVDGSGDAALDYSAMQPAPYFAHPSAGGDAALWAAMKAEGEAALAAGKVAAFTVAGGQGTRLGYDGPKGTFAVTPVRGLPLFAVFAAKIRAASARYGRAIPWYIMTSPQNHAATVAAFEAADYYGLAAEQVSFFPQGRIAAVDAAGKILMAERGRIALTPDGHGGSLRALVRSGAVAAMLAKGIEVLSYFQVDNPLVQSIDPTLIGFHVANGSEMSSKMIPKAYAGEKVGHFCMDGETMRVIEYTDLPMDLQEATDAQGRLRFIAGSIAIHCLDVKFVERVGTGSDAVKLPFHRADKKIATIDAAGNPLKPSAPNGIKFEMFVFDALPLARNPVVIETLREDDFSPVKNAEGLDSPATCRADQLRQWARWLAAVGVTVPVDSEGVPTVNFEISPLYADSAEAFAARWAAAAEKPVIADGLVLE